MRIPFSLLCLFLAFSSSFAQDYKFGKVSLKELKETVNPNDTDANASFLYVFQNTYYKFTTNDGFIKTTQVHKRIKIYNKEGFDWATEEISLRQNDAKKENLSGLKAVTYTLENGKIEETKLKKEGIFEEHNNKYWTTEKFTMPNIKEGCVIEYKYEIESPYMSIEDIDLQYSIPIKALDISVRIPEYFVFKKYVNPRATFRPNLEESVVERTEFITSNGSGGFASATNLNNRKWNFREIQTDIKLSKIPALKDESFVSNLNTYKTKLIWEYTYSKNFDEKITNYSTTWDDVTKTIYENEDFGPQLNQTTYFERDVDALIAGSSDLKEKMNRIYAFVKTKVKWNDFYGYTTDNGVQKAYEEGTGNVGDINLMLTAMLKHARIKANPMLISTRRNDIPLYPSTSAFNYVVSAVEFPDETIILDATDKFAAPNLLPIRAINWKGRIMRISGTSDWHDLTPTTSVKDITSLNAKINKDFSIDGKVRTQKTLFAAKTFRSTHENYSPEELLIAVEKGKGEIEVSNYNINGMDQVEAPIRYEYDYHLRNAIEKIGDKLFLSPMLFFTPEDNPFKQDKREYPIDFIYGVMDMYQIGVSIPEGYVVESMPKSTVVKFNGTAGEFKFISTNTANRLQFLITYSLNQPFIQPSDYNDFKQFYRLMIEKQMEKVVLKPI